MIDRYSVDHEYDHYHDVMHYGSVPVHEHAFVGAVPYHVDTSYEELNLGQVSETAPADKPAAFKPTIHGAPKVVEHPPHHAE